jgi:hypothetical protein
MNDMEASFRMAALVTPGGRDLDDLMARVARTLRAEGLAVGGVVQSTACSGDVCGQMLLTDIETGLVVNLTQNLGKLATACHLDSSALAGICGSLERQVEAGLDLVLLNRFGKAEIEGHGLRGVLEKAVMTETSVLLTVRPDYADAWRDYHGGLADDLPIDEEAVLAWCRQAARPRRLARAAAL